MSGSELSKYVGRIRTRTQCEINDVVIWSHVAKQALAEKAQDKHFLKAGVFRVPSRSRGKKVFRDEANVHRILSEAVTTKLYWSVLIYLVSRVESALGDVLRGFLRSDSRRLLIGAAGKKIEYRAVVESGGYAELMEHMITTQLHDVSYQRPSEQIEYFEKVTGVEIEANLAADWIEIKATRDILVHNDGIANAIYIAKVAGKAQVVTGVPLPIDSTYFTHSAIVMKTLIGRASALIQADLKPKNKAKKAYARDVEADETPQLPK